jgi:PemK-like, MazF-like toxin of type II toxin-antitoxin system
MPEFIKNFVDWFKFKTKLESNKQRPLFNEREVWMAHTGVNIGFEQDGKGSSFLRPVLILKKLTSNNFIGIPLSTSLKNGSWYSKSFIKGKEGRYLLNQVRLFDAKRLAYLEERIDEKEFKKVKSDFITLIEG